MACFVYLWTEEKRGLVEEAIRSSRTRADAAKKLVPAASDGGAAP